MAYTTPPTFSAGAILTALQLNTYLRDNFKAIGDAWTSYTPAWTAVTTNPVLGNGTAVGGYIQAGKYVTFRALVTAGSTTTFGAGQYQVSIPVAATGAQVQLVDAEVFDSGAAYTAKGRVLAGGSLAYLYTLPTTAGNNDRTVTPTVPFTFANGDYLLVSGTYEAA